MMIPLLDSFAIQHLNESSIGTDVCVVKFCADADWELCLAPDTIYDPSLYRMARFIVS